MSATEESACSSTLKSQTCPLQKHIRNHSWPLVLSQIKQDPSQICHHNRVGWSSLILAIYHSAPPEIISEMLCLISYKERKTLLSTPVPNGSRLCLHFATRYSSNLEVIISLTEPYPRAVLAKSDDGVTPLDRAIYYRKDKEILNWLEAETQKQKESYEKECYNQKLRAIVVECCQSRWLEVCDDDDNKPTNGAELVVQMYGYAKEREMISLFWSVLSYVGVHSIPS
jgi:hypothetical protein